LDSLFDGFDSHDSRVPVEGQEVVPESERLMGGL
jgi:hypothetical protein